MYEVEWAKVAREAAELLLAGCFSMLAVEATLGEKSGKAKRMLKWLISITIIEILAFILTSGIEAFESYLIRTKPDFWLETNVATSMATAVLIIYHTVKLLLSAAIPVIAGMWAYKQSKSVRAFTAVLLGLGVSVIYKYVYILALIPFLGENDGTDQRKFPSLMFSAALLSACLFLGYMLYKKKLLAPLKKIIDAPDGSMDKFVAVPVFSVAVFALLLSALSVFGITAQSVYWQYWLQFIIVFTCLIFIYVMMYWAIFKGVTLSTAAMKSRAELDVARHIQASALPNVFPAFPERNEFAVYASMEPAKEVGGDFYDFFLVDDSHLALVIADVSGKGIPAALFMMTARALIKSLAVSGKPPEEALKEANDRLCENNKAGMFVTAWMGILETDSGRLSFANAGHNPPLLKRGGEYRYLDHKEYHRGIMLGIRGNIRYKSNELTLEAGDALFLYTDGVTEACDKNLDLFGEERLKSCLDPVGSSTPEETVNAVKSRIEAFAEGAEQADDITVLAMTFGAFPEAYETPEIYETAVSAERTPEVSAFVEKILEKNGCDTAVIHQALIAVDEIFSNIVRYSGAERATVRCLATENEVSLSFEDNGKKYNPLNKKDPDISAPKEKRGIGGLGVFIVKKSMDSVDYAYSEGKNILTVKKKLAETEARKL
jgi:sigma-B regulation protein RsbU (phosphoserine phosphatase)